MDRTNERVPNGDTLQGKVTKTVSHLKFELSRALHHIPCFTSITSDIGPRWEIDKSGGVPTRGDATPASLPAWQYEKSNRSERPVDKVCDKTACAVIHARSLLFYLHDIFVFVSSRPKRRENFLFTQLTFTRRERKSQHPMLTFIQPNLVSASLVY